MATIVLPEPSRSAFTENQFVQSPPLESSAELTEIREQTFIFSTRGSTYRIDVRRDTSVASIPTLPDWVPPTIEAFERIRSLSANWDSYGSKSIDGELIREALSTLGAVMQVDSPAPSVVPLSDGGLQIEWHRRQQDLEITFAIDETPQFFYRNRTAGISEEGPVRSKTSKLISLLGSLG